jgi:hypothetical protein
MKKQLFLLVFMLLPLVASAEKVEIDGIFYNLNTNAQTAEVTYGSQAYVGDIVIPASITVNDVDYSVTSIGVDAFSDAAITSVIIGDNVKDIGLQAFMYCKSLVSVTIGKSVTTIGQNAFLLCTNLTKVTIGNSVNIIDDSAFGACINLPSIIIPNSVTTIGDMAFDACNELTSVTIGKGVTTIGIEAFRGCKKLAVVSIPNSVTNIEQGTFYQCNNLATVIIPNSVTSIGAYAFSECRNLTDIYCYAEQIPETGYNIFYCSNYKNATLHVPTASFEVFKNTDQWKDFGNIVALTDEDPKPTTDIAVTTATQEPAIVEHYTIDGKRVNQPQRGLNIIKMSDGTTKKVVVK